ncbi:MAG: AbgT family transporter [Spirochaetales bacterium]|nr:AbgT family transporter [Spirochaetales bacterium]
MENIDIIRKPAFSDRILARIEKTGNALPHPATLFIIFSFIVVLFSALGEALGWHVVLDSSGRTSEVSSLMSRQGFEYILGTLVRNFVSFAPLGTVLVAMLGVGVAEKGGMISSFLKMTVLSAPRHLVSAMVVFLGVLSNVASDAGYVVLVPLGAIVFMSFGRHPLAGMAAAFAGVSGGFSANLMLGTLDPLLGGITTEAARIIDSSYTVHATANWYFMIASTFLITIAGAFVTDRIVEPRLGAWKGEIKQAESLGQRERKALFLSMGSLLLMFVLLAVLSIPEGAVMRDPATGSLGGNSLLIKGIVPLLALFFFVPGLVYAFAAGTMKNDKDVVKALSETMSSMGGYLVLAFTASQFIAWFNYSGLGTVIAFKGAELLDTIGFRGFPLILAFIFTSAVINLFIGSASAKWAIMAPIFVPLLMQMGYSPELTQLAYRIGDSTTNIISPLMAYFAVIIAFANEYDEEAGMGTMISTMLPYSIVFMLGWTILLGVWILAGLPIGPGVSPYM